jgi:hypothetical protein
VLIIFLITSIFIWWDFSSYVKSVQRCQPYFGCKLRCCGCLIKEQTICLPIWLFSVIRFNPEQFKAFVESWPLIFKGTVRHNHFCCPVLDCDRKIFLSCSYIPYVVQQAVFLPASLKKNCTRVHTQHAVFTASNHQLLHACILLLFLGV